MRESEGFPLRGMSALFSIFKLAPFRGVSSFNTFQLANSNDKNKK
jgi:hypothetical protein